MLIMHKLYEPSMRNADIRDRQALLVLDARTHRLSTSKGVEFHGRNARRRRQKNRDVRRLVALARDSSILAGS